VSHLRRADALLDAGMGEAARAEARQATQLDPHLALAQERLAVILEHDLLAEPSAPAPITWVLLQRIAPPLVLTPPTSRWSRI